MYPTRTYDAFSARQTHPWWVWLSLWAGPGVSLFTVILWILLLDIDQPHLKPRPALENAAAGIVYISHSVNIVATLLAVYALLTEEYAVVLCWVCWSVIMAVIQIVLCFVSSFTVLKFIPARLTLHILSLLFAVWGTSVMLRVYRKSQGARFSGWAKDDLVKESHHHDVSRESNVL